MASLSSALLKQQFSVAHIFNATRVLLRNKTLTCFRSSFLLAISAAFSSLLKPAKLVVGVTGVEDFLISESASTQLLSPHPSESGGGGDEITVGVEMELVDATRLVVGVEAGASFLACFGRAWIGGALGVAHGSSMGSTASDSGSKPPQASSSNSSKGLEIETMQGQVYAHRYLTPCLRFSIFDGRLVRVATW